MDVKKKKICTRFSSARNRGGRGRSVLTDARSVPSFPAQLKSNETFFAAAIPDKVKKR